MTCGQPPILFGLYEAILLAEPLYQQTLVLRPVGLHPSLVPSLLVFPNSQPTLTGLTFFAVAALSGLVCFDLKVAPILPFSRNNILNNQSIKISAPIPRLLPKSAGSSQDSSFLEGITWDTVVPAAQSVFPTPTGHLVKKAVPLGLCFT